MTTALIICTYNRPEYLKRCIASLQELTEFPDFLLFVDDHSTDGTYEIIQQVGNESSVFFIPGSKLLIAKGDNRGVKDSLLTGCQNVFSDFRNIDLAINLDSDAIVKPDFITRLKDLKARFPEHIVSGFNCNHPKNPVLFDGDDYVHRRHCNGINMCMDKGQYEKHIKPALLSNGNWDYNSSHDKPFVISKPSLVEHLGYNNSTMGHKNGDVACDF